MALAAVQALAKVHGLTRLFSAKDPMAFFIQLVQRDDLVLAAGTLEARRQVQSAALVLVNDIVPAVHGQRYVKDHLLLLVGLALLLPLMPTEGVSSSDVVKAFVDCLLAETSHDTYGDARLRCIKGHLYMYLQRLFLMGLPGLVVVMCVMRAQYGRSQASQAVVTPALLTTADIVTCQVLVVQRDECRMTFFLGLCRTMLLGVAGVPSCLRRQWLQSVLELVVCCKAVQGKSDFGNVVRHKVPDLPLAVIDAVMADGAAYANGSIVALACSSDLVKGVEWNAGLAARLVSFLEVCVCADLDPDLWTHSLTPVAASKLMAEVMQRRCQVHSAVIAALCRALPDDHAQICAQLLALVQEAAREGQEAVLQTVFRVCEPKDWLFLVHNPCVPEAMAHTYRAWIHLPLASVQSADELDWAFWSDVLASRAVGHARAGRELVTRFGFAALAGKCAQDAAAVAGHLALDAWLGWELDPELLATLVDACPSVVVHDRHADKIREAVAILKQDEALDAYAQQVLHKLVLHKLSSFFA
jgi:hypothetical protein